MTEIFMKPIDFFQPHPNNAEIYSDSAIQDDLYESIKENGILQPLTALENGTVLSGHRRLARAKRLKLSELPTVIVSVPGDELDLLKIMLEFNRYREKTIMEKYREACAYQTIYTRKKGAGRTSGHIAKAVGVGSARQLERINYIVKNGSEDQISKIDAGDASISGVYDDLVKLKKEPEPIRQKAQEKVQQGKPVAQAIVESKKELAAENTVQPKASGSNSKYDFINILPNWDYADIGRTHPGTHWAKKTAPVMDAQALSELCVRDIPLSELGEDRSMLVLWVPSDLSDLASGVLQSYGYELACKLFWCRDDNHDATLPNIFKDRVLEGFVGIRGEFQHTNATNWFSGSAPAGSLPEYFYALMDKFEFKSKLEVFTASRRKGYSHYG